MHLHRRHSGLDSKGRLHISCDDMADIYKNFHISLNETYWNTASNHKSEFQLLRAVYVFSHNDTFYKLTILLHFAALFSLYKDVAKEEFIVNLYRRAEEYIRYDQYKLNSSEKKHGSEYFEAIQFIYRLRKEGKTAKQQTDEKEEKEAVKNEPGDEMKTCDVCINDLYSLCVDGSLPKIEVSLHEVKPKPSKLATDVRKSQYIDPNNPPPKPARVLPLKNFDTTFSSSSELLPSLIPSINDNLAIECKENSTGYNKKSEDSDTMNHSIYKTISRDTTPISAVLDNNDYIPLQNSSEVTVLQNCNSPKYVNDDVKPSNSSTRKNSTIPDQPVLLESYDYKSEFEKRFAKKKISIVPVTIPVIPKPHKDDTVYSYRRKGLFNDLDSRKSSRVTLQDEEEKNKSFEESQIIISADISTSCDKTNFESENHLLGNVELASGIDSKKIADNIVRAVREEKAVSQVIHLETKTLCKELEEVTDV
uniref:BUB1 N-terminal domain-containing protein n=1 Tax=Heterorhabditis bacteriophora TaxID=37862 RepID=A0A1I7X197_HETBA